VSQRHYFFIYPSS